MREIAPQNHRCAELHRKIVIVQNYTATSPQTIIWAVFYRIWERYLEMLIYQLTFHVPNGFDGPCIWI